MTRGRHANHAYIATQDNRTAGDVLTQAIAQRSRLDQQRDPKTQRTTSPRASSLPTRPSRNAKPEHARANPQSASAFSWGPARSGDSHATVGP